MSCLPGWRRRMAAFVAEVGSQPFDWQTHNCGLHWAAEHVLRMTGVDVAEAYREAAAAITDEAGAVALVQDAGFADLPALVSTLLPEIAPGQALTGDIACIPDKGRLGGSLGIVNGSRIIGLGPRGYASIDLLKASRAWRVRDA